MKPDVPRARIRRIPVYRTEARRYGPAFHRTPNRGNRSPPMGIRTTVATGTDWRGSNVTPLAASSADPPLSTLTATARSLGDRVCAAVRPLRVLDAVRWPGE